MLQILLNGIVSGLLVALPAVALSLTYGVLKFPNFAIGSMITFGAYIALFFNVVIGVPLFAAAGLAAVGLAAVALLIDRLVYRPLRGADHVTLLVASIGVYFVLENVVRFLFGSDIRGYDVTVARPHRWMGLRVNNEQILIFVVALLAMVIVWFILMRTPFGRAMRAVSDNPDLADVRGISRNKVIALVWVISAALSSTAGVLIGMDGIIDPLMGWNYVLPLFAAVILGGIGNPLGAVLGALVIGIVEEMSTLVLPTTYRQAVSFVIIALVLLLRPHGILGKPRISR